MKGKVCSFVIALQIVSFVAATSRPFLLSNDGLDVHQSGSIQSPESPPPAPSHVEGSKRWEGEEIGRQRGVRKIGSSPPSCEHKCYGCIPCEAIQVPTTSRHSHIGIQYANYEPENWKCKCGPSFYSP